MVLNTACPETKMSVTRTYAKLSLALILLISALYFSIPQYQYIDVNPVIELSFNNQYDFSNIDRSFGRNLSVKKLDPHDTFVIYWTSDNVEEKVKQFNKLLLRRIGKHLHATSCVTCLFDNCTSVVTRGIRRTNFTLLRGFRDVVWKDLIQHSHLIGSKAWAERAAAEGHAFDSDDAAVRTELMRYHTLMYDWKSTGGPGVTTYILSSLRHSQSRSVTVTPPFTDYYNCYIPPKLKSLGGWEKTSGSMTSSLCHSPCSDDVTVMKTPVNIPDLALHVDYTSAAFKTSCERIRMPPTYSKQTNAYIVHSNWTSDILTAIDVVTIGGIVSPDGNVLTNAKQGLFPFRCNKESRQKDALTNVQYCELLYKSKFVREVFTLSQFPLAGNFYHFSIEQLTRIAGFVYFLQHRPFVAIHIDSRMTPLMSIWLKAYGLSNPVISGLVIADVIYMPHGGGCHNPHLLSVQLAALTYHRYIRRHLFTSDELSHFKATMIVIKRTKRFTVNHDDVVEMLTQVARNKPYEVVVFDDKNLPSLEDTMRLFFRATLIIGANGAGFANMIYAQPGATIIEIHCQTPRYVRLSLRMLALKLGMRYFGMTTTRSTYLSKRCNLEGVIADLSEMKVVLDYMFG